MKFSVLVYTTFIVQCMAAVKSSDSESYLAGVTSVYSWAGCVKRFYILTFVIPCVLFYYIPESRYYARKACLIMIDLVASGLKAALSGSFGNESCIDVGRSSYYSDRFMSVPEIQSSLILATAHQKDHLNPSHTRRRHRVRQDSKIEEDKTRGHDRRKHRHSERSRYGRDEKIRNAQHHQSQLTQKTTSKVLEVLPSPSPPLHFYSDRTTDGFYYPGTQNDDIGAKFSTSFVISGVKTTSNVPDTESNRKQEIFPDLEEEDYPQIVCKQRSRPSKRTRPEDAIYPENDGPTRDSESFVSTELNCSRSYDIESKIGFSTTTLDYPEKECDASGYRDPPRHEDSATTVQESDGEVEDWEKTTDKRAPEQKEDVEDDEENRTTRVKDATFPVRKVNFQKKERDRNRKKITEDEDDRASNTKSEEVLGQLGDQIAKLEKTIRMMKPETTKQGRGHRTREDYAVQNIETVLKDMKRSFSKVDERIKRRRKPNPSRDDGKERSRASSQLQENLNFDSHTAIHGDAESATSFLEGNTFEAGSLQSSLRRGEEKTAEELPEEESMTSQQDLTILRSEMSLEDEEELAPILTNRVKPYLIRTFDWLFTGCPGVSADKKYSVGKDGDLRTASEWVP